MTNAANTPSYRTRVETVGARGLAHLPEDPWPLMEPTVRGIESRDTPISSYLRDAQVFPPRLGAALCGLDSD
jgi:hypothetical protein